MRNKALLRFSLGIVFVVGAIMMGISAYFLVRLSLHGLEPFEDQEQREIALVVATMSYLFGWRLIKGAVHEWKEL